MMSETEGVSRMKQAFALVDFEGDRPLAVAVEEHHTQIHLEPGWPQALKQAVVVFSTDARVEEFEMAGSAGTRNSPPCLMNQKHTD